MRVLVYRMLAGAVAAILVTTAHESVMGATYYVDGNVASAGSGLSWETALKTIQQGYSKLSSPGADLVLIRGDLKYTVKTQYMNKNGISDSQRHIWRGVPGTNGMGRMPIITGATDYDESSFSTTSGLANVYWIPETASPLAVWEGPSGGEWGNDWTEYTEQAGPAAVQAASGSWYADGANLFVHTTDGNAPSGFIIKSTTATEGIRLNASYMNFENIEFRFYDIAIEYWSSGATNVNYHSNVVHHCLMHGVYDAFKASAHARYVGNTAFAIDNRAFWHGNSSADGVVFAGNTLYEMKGVALAGADREVHGNTIYDGYGLSLFLTGDNVDVYNNLIYNTGGGNGGIRINNAANARVYNNTCYSNTAASSYEIFIDNNSTNARVFNNIMWATEAGGYGIFVQTTATNGFQSDYNVIYTSGGAWAGRWDRNARPTLADWQAASGQDAYSTNLNPRFANAATGDFHLDNLSPCLNAGVASFVGVSAPSIDIDGDVRPILGSYDIGCDERVPVGSMITIQ